MIRFRDVAKEYLEQDAPELAGTTLADRRKHLRPGGMIDQALGDIPISKLRNLDIRKWWGSEIKQKRTHATGRRYLSTIAAVVHRAIEYELISHDPVAEFRASLKQRRTKKLRAETDPGKHIRPIETVEELERILAEARAEGLVHLVHVLLLLDAGLRMGEAIELEWGDVHWGADENDRTRHLDISRSNPRGMHAGDLPKSGRSRRVGMSRRLQSALRELYRERFQPGPEQKIAGCNPDSWRAKHWRRILKRANCKAYRPKDLRDSYASYLLTAGIQIGYIARQIGHSTPLVTAQHYAKWVELDEYRAPELPGPGELPADVLARLGRSDRSGEKAWREINLP